MADFEDEQPPDLFTDGKPPSDLFTDIQKPIANVTPEMQRAEASFGQEFPITGNLLNVGQNLLTGMATPLNLGLTALSFGSGIAGRFGLPAVASALELPGKLASYGMMGEGAKDIFSAPDWSGKAAGLGEAGLGMLGLRSHLTDVTESQNPRFKYDRKTKMYQPLDAITEEPLGPGLTKDQKENIEPIQTVGKTPILQDALRTAGQVSDLSKSLVTAGHFSAPFRQGVGLIFNKSWWGAWDDMIKAGWSPEKSAQIDTMIKSDPNYERFVQSGGELTRLNDGVNQREDAIRSTLAEKLPLGVGNFVRAGNRAYTAFLNTARMGAFSNLIEDASTAAQAIQDPQLRMESDPKTNMALSKAFAEYVNAASGRGSLGSLEKHADALNAVFFSPRLQAARIQLVKMALDPSTPQVVRKQALKSMAGIMAVGTTVASLGQLGGGEVSSDPTSADYGKVKIGNTRIDPWTGYQQDMVLFSRLANSMRTSSTTGKTTQFGGYGAPTALSTILDFAKNRATPPLGVAYDWANNHKVRGGWSFRPASEAASMMAPILVKTVYDLSQENPGLIPVLGPLNAVGIGVENYR